MEKRNNNKCSANNLRCNLYVFNFCFLMLVEQVTDADVCSQKFVIILSFPLYHQYILLYPYQTFNAVFFSIAP